MSSNLGGGSLGATRMRAFVKRFQMGQEDAARDAARHELDAAEEEAAATRHAEERRARREAQAAGSADDAGGGQAG
jgi:hypothetical protein